MEQASNSRDETTGAARAETSERVNETPNEAPEIEEESAEAMDSDVPQPPDASKTTEGQPS